MNKEPDEIPEEHQKDAENEHKEEPQHHFSIDDFSGSGDGISLSRMEEIQDAEARGEPLDLSDEERAEYETAKARMADVMDSFRQSMMEPYEGINQRLKDIVASSFQVPKMRLPPHLRNPITPNVLREPSIPEMPLYTAPEPLVSEDDWEAMAEATQERDKRQDEIRGNTFETAVAMKGMLDAMAAEAERVKAQSKTDNWRWWVIAAITVLTLLTAAIPAIPLIVDWWPW